MSGWLQKRLPGFRDGAGWGIERHSRRAGRSANRYRNRCFAELALALLLVFSGYGRAAEDAVSGPESFEEWEHSIWLGVQGQILSAEEASALQERLRTLVEDEETELVWNSERLRESLSVPAEAGSSLSGERLAGWMLAIDEFEEERRERLADAAGNLAFAWIDELALFPEADRSAWIRSMRRWASVEGFTPALERGRIFFLSLLPKLSLPSADASLNLTEVQARLLQGILTGAYEGEGGVTQNLVVPRNRWSSRRGVVWGLSAMMLLECQAAYLGVTEGEAKTKHDVGAKGAIKDWREYFDDQELWFHPRVYQPTDYGVWDVDLEFLTGSSIYQKTIREIVSLETYAAWLQACRSRRMAGMNAMGDYVVAKLNLQLQLSPRQLARAESMARIFDAGKDELRERVLKNVSTYNHVGPDLLNPYRREATLYDSYSEFILQGLIRGELTPWQRQAADELLPDEAE